MSGPAGAAVPRGDVPGAPGGAHTPRAGPGGPRASGDGPRCPWCGSDDVERIGAFGAQLMSEQYLCRACRSPFERVRR
jgi:ring-1,2-phenylacetyl-CoA epoxidase subunit PaaD